MFKYPSVRFYWEVSVHSAKDKEMKEIVAPLCVLYFLAGFIQQVEYRVYDMHFI